MWGQKMGSEGSRLAESEQGVWFWLKRYSICTPHFNQKVQRAQSFPGAGNVSAPQILEPRCKQEASVARESICLLQPAVRYIYHAGHRVMRFPDALEETRKDAGACNNIGLNQYFGMKTCFGMVQAYETGTGHSYSHVMRIRPDVVYMRAPVPDLAFWKTDHIHDTIYNGQPFIRPRQVCSPQPSPSRLQSCPTGVVK